MSQAEKQFERTIVHVRKGSGEEFHKADFNVCLMDYFGMNDGQGLVQFFLKNNKVYLEPHDNIKGNDILAGEAIYIGLFQHPSFCVVKKLSVEEKNGLPPEILNRGVDVGVSSLIESLDGHLLITRRSPHMRTFPGVWVPPGGHAEEGETLIEIATREVKEEIGLALDEEEYRQYRVLGLWESMYPPVIYMGLPKRHHLVIYLHIKVNKSTGDLQRRLKLDYEEVDAIVWLTKAMVEIVVNGSNKRKYDDVPITLVNDKGELEEGWMGPKALRKKMPEPGREIERMTTGTRYALKLWLQDQP